MTDLAYCENPAGHDRLELLSDRKGVYGVGFLEPPGHGPGEIILRPDLVPPPRHCWAILQPVPNLLRVFRRSAEVSLVDELTKRLFKKSMSRRGEDIDVNNFSLSDPGQRRIFFGNRAKAYHITNSLIREALTVADQDALRRARRYRLKRRACIYWLATRNERLSQLCETFPLLAWILSDELSAPSREPPFPAEPVADAVKSGLPLRQIARLAGLPYVMRNVPPIATSEAFHVRELFIRNPHLMQQMPSGSRAARAWFSVLFKAYGISPDYAEWCARNIEIRRPYEDSSIAVSNVGDWIETSYEKHVQASIEDLTQRLSAEVPPQFIERRFREVFPRASSGVELVTRTFKPSMSARTVSRLSDEWHNAVADQKFSGDTKPFPKAWATPSEIGEYRIVPLETPLDLHHEGRAMHNCATTYDNHVRSGACYLFSLQKDEKRVATVEIGIGSDGFHLAQFSGLCNQRVDKKLEHIIRKWARTTKFEREEPRTQAALPNGMDWCPANENAGDLADEIPF